MMSVAFDPGYHQQPFLDLCTDYPDAAVYDPKDFRVEWGPIFHRGRLDGTARLLVIGQDPAQHETIVRRILVGMAGRRTQGFLAKVGINVSYVMINTFLYSVYGQGGGERHQHESGIIAYRARWFKAITGLGGIEAVVALGSLADGAWTAWVKTVDGQSSADLPDQHIPHPTWPESASHSEAERKANTKIMLARWNAALAALLPNIEHPDVQVASIVSYGEDFTPADLGNIPAQDFPAGLPAWMRGDQEWATRTGADAATKRSSITVTVPSGVIP